MDKSAMYAKAAELYKAALAEGSDPDESRAAYDAAVSRIAAMPDTPAQGESAANAPAPLTLGEKVKGTARTLASGALFGFADEAEGFAKKMFSPNKDVTYEGARDQVRNEQSRFQAATPKGVDFGLEVAGGMGANAGIRALGARGLKGATALANSAIAQGALGGAGASESETLGGVAADAAIGGVVGGTLGSVIGKAGGKIMEMGRRATLPAAERAPTLAGRRAVTALANRMGQGKITPDVLEVAGGANTAKDARIVDNMGVVGERTARGLRTLGEEAGEMIDTFGTTRQRTQVERMTDALYNGKSVDDVVQAADDFVRERKALSTPVYEQFRAQPAAYIPEVEELFKRPLFAKAVTRAEEYMKNAGQKPTVLTLGNGQTAPVRSPEFLDNVKKSLDDMIFLGKQPGEGGMGPGAMKQAKELRAEFVDILDKKFPYYAEARNLWAGETALKEALEDGVEAAKSSITPEALSKEFGALSESQRDLFRRGYMDQLRQRLENGGLKPASLEQRAFLKRIDVVFGDDANLMLTRLRDEIAATRTANNIVGGSQTADKGVEVMDELVPEKSSVWASAIYNPARTASNFAGKYVGSKIPLFRDTRTETAKMLLSPADNQDVIKRLAAEYKTQELGKNVRNNVAGPLAAATSYGFFRRPSGEQR